MQKFYLVNPYVIGYVVTLISGRWLWACVKTLLLSVLPQSWQKGARHFSQIIIITGLSLAYFYCVSLVGSDESAEDESYIKFNKTFRMGCLLYPYVYTICYIVTTILMSTVSVLYRVFVMAATYQEDIQSYLELVPDGDGIIELSSSSQQYLNSSVQHKCSNDPVQIRQEVESLRQVCFKNKLFWCIHHICGYYIC